MSKFKLINILKNKYWIIFLLFLFSPLVEPILDYFIGDNNGIVTKWGFHDKIIWIQIWGSAISLIVWSLISKNFFVVNLTITVWIWLLLEIGFTLFSNIATTTTIRTSDNYGQYFKKDTVLGFKFQPSVSGTSLKIANQEDTIYNVTYRIDEFSRRLSTKAKSDSVNYALFFGGSFTFGEGVAEEATIPSRFAEYTAGYHAYNFGMPGCGPLQMYAYLENQLLLKQIQEKNGIVIFNFIHGHINRTIGSIRFINTYGKWQPKYELKNGEFIRNNNQFYSNSRIKQHLFKVLYKSNILDYVGILDIPMTQYDAYDYTAQFFKAASQLYQKQFDNDNFYVVIYPGENNKMVEYFQKHGVKVIDLSHIFSATENRLHPTDLHPTNEGNKLYVKALIKALRKDLIISN